jgi:hypothetical protein
MANPWGTVQKHSILHQEMPGEKFRIADAAFFADMP